MSTTMCAAAQAGPTSAERPWRVSRLNAELKGWINRLGAVWVEGELAQINYKPTWSLSYLTLRDTEEQKSIRLTCPSSLVANSPTPLQEGARVIVHGRVDFYEGRGEISIRVSEIRPVGIGELLARIEALRKQLAAEGLFDPARKKPLPFLPKCVGLITGRDSAAERDVLKVAHERWPQVRFTTIHSAVQGANAVPQVIAALQQLDADPEVDVIIIARGGGSVEDLLPFSEEALQRAVAMCGTPVVSAIGHEPDNPILDNVADLRAATPTDAAKKVVPDVNEERLLLLQLRQRSAAALYGWVDRERKQLDAIRSRPVLAEPERLVSLHREELERSWLQIRREIRYLVDQETNRVASLRSQVAALGPGATLARGYAVVQVLPRDHSGPQVVTGIEQSPPGSQLRIRVTDGSISAAAMGTTPAD